MSLVNGRIPVGQVCPYRSHCPSAKNSTCGHKGVDHPVPYSCGYARAFMLFGTPIDTVAK